MNSAASTSNGGNGGNGDDAMTAYGLIAAGIGLMGLTRNFKRRGLLRPYKMGYAATWITLGSGIMQYTQLGNEERIRQVVEAQREKEREREGMSEDR